MGKTVSHAAIVLAAVAPLAAPARPSLAGKWVLNKVQSEDARTKVREAAGGGRPRGYEGAQGGMGGPGGGRMGGGFGGPGARGGGDGRRGLQRFLDPPETLTITQTEEEIAIDDGQAVYRLHPDGRKTKSQDGEIERAARWQGAELTVEATSPRGPVTTAYSRVPEKKQLHVTTRFEARSGQTVTVRRVYDEAETP